jgi:hypothetical protein
MDLITVDFETYYDRDFSLSKITTEEYVRSDLFEVIGVSVKDQQPRNGVGKWNNRTNQTVASEQF